MYINLKENPLLGWPLVLILVAALYLFVNLAIPLLPNPSIGIYVIQPLLWLFVAGAIFFLPKQRTFAKPRVRRNLIMLALMIGFFQVLLYAIGGLFSGFGKSPYSFTATGILSNLFLVGATLVGMEMSRAWLVNRLGRYHTFVVVVLVTFLYTLVDIPLRQLTGISLTTESAAYLNSVFFPLLSENLLATVLALLAGPLASISYRGMLLLFWWFMPIIPDLPWAIIGFIGTAVPILSLLAVRNFYRSQTERFRARRGGERSLTGWVMFAVVSVAVIWFSVGLFPVHPTLIGSGSMEPVMYAGDVSVVAEVEPENIKEGDIIQFRTAEDYTILHRVIEVIETGGVVSYITKGDANDEPDKEPVLADNVVGKVIFTVPKIGWVAVWVKGFFT